MVELYIFFHEYLLLVIGIFFNIIVSYDCKYVKHIRAMLIDQALYEYFYYLFIYNTDTDIKLMP